MNEIETSILQESAADPVAAGQRVDWNRLREIVDSHHRFLITSHVRPDGDSLGSMLAMARMLDQKGKESQVVCPSPMPPRYRFLDPEHRILQVGKTARSSDMDRAEVVLILDTSAWVQLAGMADFVRGTSAAKVVIDHHVGHDEMGAELFKSVTAAACGELLADALDPLGCKLTPEIADPLFVAISTDTGWFRFSSTTSHTLETAARLIDAGVRVDALYRRLFEENSEARLRLIGRALQGMQLSGDGRVADIAIRLSDLAETGAVPQDSEDLVNYTVSLSGVEVGLMFIEQVSHAVKVSFRSQSVDCTRLAARFSGGGHRAAAGAMVHLPFDAARAAVLQAVHAALDEAKP